MKTFFRIIFILNAIWGGAFGIRSAYQIHTINNDEEYNCPVTYQEYAAAQPDAPDLFGSKKLAYYTVYAFFNFTDTPSWNADTDFECFEGALLQTFTGVMLLIVWIIPMLRFSINSEKQFLLILPTLLSITGIMWWYQAWQHIGF